MKNKIIIVVFVLLIILSNKLLSQDVEIIEDYKYSKASSLLTRLTKDITDDSLLITYENDYINKRYYLSTKCLTSNTSGRSYFEHVFMRYLFLCNNAKSEEELINYSDSLYFFLSEYSSVLYENNDYCKEIARSVISFYESSSYVLDYNLINKIVNRISRQISVTCKVVGEKEKKKNIVDTYVKFYALRGMISIAAPIYSRFSYLYSRGEMEAKTIMFSKDYILYLKDGTYTCSINSTLKQWRILAFNLECSNFDLVMLIAAIRASNRLNQGIPFIIVRDKMVFGDIPISGLANAIASDFYYVNIDSSDIEYYKNAPSFIVQKDDGSIIYSGNNAIDFLQWLKKPFAKKDSIRDIEIKHNIIALKSRRDSLKKLPIDTTIVLKKSFENIHLLLKGNWPKGVSIDINSFYFTKSTAFNSDENEISMITIYNDNKTPIYSQWIINPLQGKEFTISLIRNWEGFVYVYYGDNKNKELLRKLDRLNRLNRQFLSYKYFISEYPFHESNFYKYTIQREKDLQFEIDSLVSSKYNKEPIKSILSISRVMQRLQSMSIGAEIGYKQFDSLMNMYYFDPIIYRSPFYGGVINMWLSINSSNLRYAIDFLFGSKRWIPDEALEFVGQSIWKKMNAIGRNDLMQYIDTAYLSSCGSDLEIKNRIEGYKRMSIGNRAPDFVMDSSNSEKTNLYSRKAKKTIILFWASACSHCQKVLPQIYKLTQSDVSIDVIAIGLDNNNQNWEDGIKQYPVWTHIQAKDRWNDSVVQSYAVIGTPTIFVLNDEKIIIGTANKLSDLITILKSN